MSTNSKEPGESLAIILIVVAACIIGWTIFIPFAGIFSRMFHFLPRLVSFRPYYRQWGLFHWSEINVNMRLLVFGILIGLVLFALAYIIRAINANTRELRRLREVCSKRTEKGQ